MVLCDSGGRPALIYGRGGGLDSLEPYKAVVTDGAVFVYG